MDIPTITVNLHDPSHADAKDYGTFGALTFSNGGMTGVSIFMPYPVALAAAEAFNAAMAAPVTIMEDAA